MMCRMPGKNTCFGLKPLSSFPLWIRSQAQIEAASFIQQARGAKSPSPTFQHWKQSGWRESRVNVSFIFDVCNVFITIIVIIIVIITIMIIIVNYIYIYIYYIIYIYTHVT